MKKFQRVLVSLLMLGSLAFLMGQDGFCIFAGEEGGGLIITD